ncbi:MAG: flagellar hook-basal body complex protein [Peptostreptococcaceae bacterium]|nr:flagellar hook-basal body complex protein [Peptostreptococcaceae bacterium]
MLRSLYAGVSGMRSNQVKMDVIGNNIANVNTTAFKSGRARFQDLFSQTLANAQMPSDTGLGGINPKQVGLGVGVAAIDTVMSGGSLKPTGRELDFAIEGEGFFVVSRDSAGDMKRYTRDGAFFTDYEGNLVNAEGLRVLGYAADGLTGSVGAYDHTGTTVITSPSDSTQSDLLVSICIPNEMTVGANTVSLETFSIDGSGLIQGIYSDGEVYSLGQIGIGKFKNPGGLDKLGGNTYRDTRNSGEVEVGVANENGFGAIRPGVLEMSNVDLANEFTEMIITSRAYQANAKTISTSDEMLQELINLKR